MEIEWMNEKMKTEKRSRTNAPQRRPSHSASNLIIRQLCMNVLSDIVDDDCVFLPILSNNGAALD